MNFEGIYGNEKVKKMLLKLVESNNILHSYLFFGIDGIGKKIIARDFAQMILCSNNGNACGNCKSCVEFMTNNHPDFYFIEPDGKSVKIDQIREMQKKVMERPIISTRKVFIINDADKMTVEAQNCLLKTLEEPQDFVTIILIATNDNDVLPTVKSRCLKIFCDKLSNEQLKLFFKNNYNIDVDETTIKLSNGSVKKALEVASLNDVFKQLEDAVKKIDIIDKLEFLKLYDIFVSNKDKIASLLEYLVVILYEIIKRKNNFFGAIYEVESAKVALSKSNNFDMVIDKMLISLWEEFNEKYSRC